jgi:exopolysaccharide production protein ExoQ
MRYFDVKNAIVVLGVALYCVASIANVDETSPLSFLHSIYAPCLYALYLLGATYFFTHVRDKLEFGHEVYLLFCLYIFMSILWSDHPREVVANTVHSVGLFFVCITICDAIGDNYRRFIWTAFFTVSIVSAVSVVSALALPDTGIIYDTSWSGLNSEFSLNGRWSGITDHPNTLGSYAALGLLTGAYLLVEGRKAPQSASSLYTVLMILGALLANFVALIGSDSKTSLSSSVFAILFYFFVRNALGWFHERRLRDLAINFNVGVAATVALVVAIKQLEIDKLLFQSLGRDSELTGRTWLWALGWDAISERPLAGWSFDYFNTLKDSYGAFEYNQFHNVVIDLLAKGGIIAAIFGIIMYFTFTSNLDQGAEKRDAVQFATLYLPFLLLSSYTEANLFIPQSFVWFFFLICWFYLLRRTRGPTGKSLAIA